MKKNLTLSLPTELIRSAKVYAAKRGTSINALVKESLNKMVRQDGQRDAALRRILSPKNKFWMGKKLSRAELYD